MSVRSNSSAFELQMFSWLKLLEDPYAYAGIPCFASEKEVNTAYDILDSHLIMYRKNNPSEIKSTFINYILTINRLLREEAHQLRDLSSPEEKQHLLSQTKHTKYIEELRHLKKIYSLQFPDRYALINTSFPIKDNKEKDVSRHSSRLVMSIADFLHSPFEVLALSEFAAPQEIEEKFQRVVKKMHDLAKNNPNDPILQKAISFSYWYSDVLKNISHIVTNDIPLHFPDIHSQITTAKNKKIKKKAIKLIVDNIHSLPGYKNLSKLKDRL